jgi:DNA invertase Pin-like site-specific DNA recombinase
LPIKIHRRVHRLHYHYASNRAAFAALACCIPSINDGWMKEYTHGQGQVCRLLRVSTQKQGNSGLGLEAQRAAVLDWLNGGKWELVAEHTEVESGKHADRPVLAQAMQDCKLLGAKLVIAKLDRLSRDAHFLLGLEKSGIDFVATDMPNANRLTVGIMAMVADEERRMISARTKAALAAAKARGIKLGGTRPGQRKADPAMGTAAIMKASADFAARVLPMVSELHDGGRSLRNIAAELTARGIQTMRGGAWTADRVRHLLMRSAA